MRTTTHIYLSGFQLRAEGNREETRPLAEVGSGDPGFLLKLRGGLCADRNASEKENHTRTVGYFDLNTPLQLSKMATYTHIF